MHDEAGDPDRELILSFPHVDGGALAWEGARVAQYRGETGLRGAQSDPMSIFLTLSSPIAHALEK